jgi:4,5-DOPA dioxygenase extradiol
MRLKEFKTALAALTDTPRMPVLFVGHGSPMNGIEDNRFSRAWTSVGATVPRPRAVLCVSAHWLTEGTFVHGAENPRTIHDFWGFPPELYAMRYPCPGDEKAAKAVQSLEAPVSIGWDLDWGVDHGNWIVMTRMFPKADVPVFQLSLDLSKPSRTHYDIGAALAPLRRKGVLIVGSGNIVHNLGMLAFEEMAKPFGWADEFDALASGLLEKGDHASLVAYENLGHAARLAVPTPDHYWPMLYVLGLQEKDERPEFFIDGITHGSVSMRGFVLGR